MAVITLIDGVPLYTTIQEALDWADSRGLSTYHQHLYQGVTGYMGGSSHSQAFLSSNNNNLASSTPRGGASTGGGGATGSSGGGGY